MQDATDQDSIFVKAVIPPVPSEMNLGGVPGPRLMPGGAKVAAKKKKPKGAKKPGQKKENVEDYSDSGSDSAISDDDFEGNEGYKKGGYHPVRIGERYKSGRYTVLQKLGWGHFSTVWLVHDATNGRQVAMKVQKSAPHYTEAALDEIKLLSEIAEGDVNDERHCVRLLDHFEHVGPHGRHVCMIFETLGDNLLALIKRYNYRGIPIPIVRELTRQMLIGLDYCHRERSIIHTDFKPENAMLTQPLTPREPVDVEALLAQAAARPAAEDAAAAAAAAPAAAASPTPSAAPSASVDADIEVDADPSPSAATETAADDGATPALTKNQKKKLKKKRKKQQAQGGGGGGGGGEEEEEEEGEGAGGATNGGGVFDPVRGSRVVDDARVFETWRLADWRCKIVDFGNSCWTYRQFTSDIQTRQYRSPEVMLGQKYGTPVDMWSMACVVFELVTGDLLFDPREDGRREYTREEDHLALMIELLGPMPKRMWQSGKLSRDYFNSKGELRHIKKLKFWPLIRVLTEKYKMDEEEARALSDFLVPMLNFVPEERATARAMLAHPWLQGRSLATGEMLGSAYYTPRGADRPCGPSAAPAPAPEESDLDFAAMAVDPEGGGPVARASAEGAGAAGQSMDVEGEGEGEAEPRPPLRRPLLMDRGAGEGVRPENANAHVHAARSDSPSPAGHGAAGPGARDSKAIDREGGMAAAGMAAEPPAAAVVQLRMQ